MEIREILKADLSKLSRLMVEVYNAPPWNDKWTEETALESLSSLCDFPNFTGYLIGDGNNIIGAILGHSRKYATETTYYIDEFFISEKYRRLGLGDKLYNTTINQLKKKAISGAFFTTLKNSPAYNFYIKEGAWDLEDSACFYHKF